jgi:hypothetical protein
MNSFSRVAADRSANHDAWTSPKVREVITRRGIKLTNYREIAAEIASGKDRTH